jgi:hypothetical protein
VQAHAGAVSSIHRIDTRSVLRARVKATKSKDRGCTRRTVRVTA